MNEIMRDKKNMINDIGYCILHLLDILLFDKLYIPNKCIAINIQKYA